MNINTLRQVYFIGIGGIGMSAIARFFMQRGVQVSGYDRTETPLTKALSAEGAAIHYEDNPALAMQDAELVVYTPAIPQDHRELAWFQSEGKPVYKRSDVLQWITESMTAITVAGTHGKTTVSTMIAYLLREAGAGANAFLGGISANYGVNYWSSDEDVAVIEADEYDRSFLKLSPDIAVLTALDADHLDIYGTHDNLLQAFAEYTRNVKPGGLLLHKHGLSTKNFGTAERRTYALQNDAADYYAANIRQEDGGYHFDFHSPEAIIADLYLPMGGMHNVENAVAALAVATRMGATETRLKPALQGFQGIRRRFEYVVKNEQHVYIDDYAHHPEELSALITSAKRLFPERRCVVAFQPHLFSRTRDFVAGFAEALDHADEILLLPIYPARELPVEGVTTEIIAERMGNPAHTVLSPQGVLDYVRSARPSLFVTAGAGDIDKLVSPIKDILLLQQEQPA